jgi:SAM-dependent methyltransferase
MTDLDELFEPGSFDAVVANGVIGFGLDDPADCERAVRACHEVLRPGGWLVLGWNDVDDLRPVRLEDLQALQCFEASVLPPFTASRHPTFSPARHTYDFYRRPAPERIEPHERWGAGDPEPPAVGTTEEAPPA